MSTKLFYNRFVDEWLHALPLGNGRIGAMVYGNPNREIIEINEESLWSGRQIEEQYHATPEALGEIRRLIAEERLSEAEALCYETLMSDPQRVRFFESFGEILIKFLDEESEPSDYRKELDLKDAVAKVSWTKNGISYQSESFVSEKYDLFVYRLEASAPFSCNVTMKRRQNAYTSVLSQEILTVNGKVTYFEEIPKYGAGGEGMSFGARLKIETDGARKLYHDSITVENATSLTVYAAFATNYNVQTFDIDESKDYRKALNDCIAALNGACYCEIKERHVEDHRADFDGVSFALEGPDYSEIPTDERLQAVKDGGEDPDLCTLYYNMGRYLLLSCSGKNATLPANLQGMWCHDFRPAWGGDYHTNINVQMNYWPAETGNCSDTVNCLTHFVKMLSLFGKRTAKELYGAGGWTVHHTTDIFGRTGIHDLVGCGTFPMGGPWMCLPLWEHYEYTGDLDYLKEIYPILKESCAFLCDFLTENEEGYLITSPSNSPENTFWYDHPDGTRKSSKFTQGATFDFQLIYALFTRTKYACDLLGDGETAQKLSDVLSKLPPLRISQRYGTICEWIKDYEEKDPGHRHISHLFGLYPSDQISETDPQLYEAAKKTIDRRLEFGGGQTGWSRAWMINFLARFKDGNQAYHHLQQLFVTNTAFNLFDLHPPKTFQIDGNLGAFAGINEMLIQSHLGTFGQRIVELLPALPDAWSTGSVKGLKARGNFTFDFAWKNGALTEVTVTSQRENVLRLKLPQGQDLRCEKEYTVENSILKRNFRTGESVTFYFSQQ